MAIFSFIYRWFVRLVGGLVFVIVLVVLSAYLGDGLRYPPLQFEPDPAPRSVLLDSGVTVLADGAFYKGVSNESLIFRAFQPEPGLEIGVSSQPLTVVVRNIHPEATLESESLLDGIELVNGLERRLQLPALAQPIKLSWRFPERDQYRFVAIGDTGGARELAWLIARAHELRADFFLHLGDISYTTGDFYSGLQHLNRALIPTYISIGNHDYHDSGRSVHQTFINEFGPLNYWFDLGRVRFVNLDTAADSFPPHLGPRGRLIKALPELGQGEARFDDYVVFTHKPLTDPRNEKNPEHDHAVNGPGEASWIHKQLLRRGITSLLAGHVHMAADYDDQGLRTLMSGLGLAHTDLLPQAPIAKLVVGSWRPGERVEYQWRTINMPIDRHCHPRTLTEISTIQRLISDVSQAAWLEVRLKMLSAGCNHP